MSTSLVQQQPTFPTGADFDAMRNAAAIISRSGLVPEAFRGKPEDVMVAILTARGLGLDPMVALQKGYVVKGKFDIEVSVKLGLVMSRVPDFDYEIVALDDEHAIVEGGRSGKNRVQAEFTYAQAVAAGLTQSKYGDKETWKFYRRDMLLNRALGRVLKLTCAHALYNMPVALDEEPEGDPRLVVPAQEPGPAHDFVASGAVVVEDGAAAEAGQAPTPRAPVPTAVPAPEDWQGRLLRAAARHYGRTEPGEHKNAYAKWVKANGADLGKLVNLYYAEKGLDSVKAWVAVPPMDYEPIARWLENREAKRAGAEGPSPSGGKDAAPAQEVVAGQGAGGDSGPVSGETESPPATDLFDAPPEDDEPAAEPEIVSGWQRLVPKGHLYLTNLLMAMRHATKGERQFVERSAKSGNYILKDNAILLACGMTNSHGTAVTQWLHKLQEGVVWDGVTFSAPNESVWPMVVRAVYEEAERMKVSTEL